MLERLTVAGETKEVRKMASNAIGQPGKVFNAQVSIRERSDAGEISNSGRVWIDADQRKGRFELRQDDSIIGMSWCSSRYWGG